MTDTDRRFADQGDNLSKRARSNAGSDADAAAFAADAASDAAYAADTDTGDDVTPSGTRETPTQPDPAPVSAPAPAGGGPLLSGEDAEAFRARWQSVQAGFVDDPRQSVEEADGLLEQVAVRFAQSLTAARTALRDGWDGTGAAGGAADDAGTSTERLRGTLQDYRQLVNHLLGA